MREGMDFADRPRPSNARLLALGVLVPTSGFAAIGRARQGWWWFALFFLCLLALPLSPLVLLVVPPWWLVAVLAPLVLRGGLPPARLWPDVLLRVALGVVCSTVVCTITVEAVEVRRDGMRPTLEVGDHVLASTRELWSRGPERGELIVFARPARTDEDLVKRVVGLPGDTVEVQNDELIVNGSAVRADGEPWSCAEAGSCRREVLDGRAYTIVVNELSPARDFPASTVPPGHYFVLGDNRSHASDSRLWGPVPAGNLKGVLRYVYWSAGPDGVRWSRLGRRLDQGLP
jgi:signal peptidase I